MTRDRVKKTLTVTQKTYTKKVLARFGISDYAPVDTPMVAGTQLHKETLLQANTDDKLLYQSIVGSLMYTTIETRADIGFAVTTLSRFN